MAQSADLFDLYFQRADLDRDGRISGAEAVSFFQASGLPKQVLAKVWDFADQKRTGFLGRPDFYNALRLVTVAQSKRELTPELVKAALYGPAAAKIPAPQMNLSGMPTSQLNNTPSRLVSQTSRGDTLSLQNVGPGGPQQRPVTIPNQQHYMPQASQMLRPSQPLSTSSLLTQAASPQGFPFVTASVGPRPPAPSISDSLMSGEPVRYPAAMQVSNSGVAHTTTHAYGVITSGGTGSLPPRPHVPPSVVPSRPPATDNKKIGATSNGLTADSIFGDVFTTIQSQPIQEPPSANAPTASLATFLASSVAQPSIPSTTLFSYQSSEALHPVANHTQVAQSAEKLNQHASHPTTSDVSFSTVLPLAGKSSPSLPQSPWPKMTQTDVQKYMKVFMEVDKDKDGKITGGEARNLFLSWKLSRGISPVS